MLRTFPYSDLTNYTKKELSDNELPDNELSRNELPDNAIFELFS